jgi:hypothetical protein
MTFVIINQDEEESQDPNIAQTVEYKKLWSFRYANKNAFDLIIIKYEYNIYND